jgi:malate dehydrogenase (oxaloacetate-decarboxylating)(NADP+)
MFIDAARALASQVALADAADGAVYPELTRIRQCSHAVACAVIRRAIVEGQSALPRGAVVEDLVTEAMWFPEYREIRYEPRVELAAVR